MPKKAIVRAIASPFHFSPGTWGNVGEENAFMPIPPGPQKESKDIFTCSIPSAPVPLPAFGVQNRARHLAALVESAPTGIIEVRCDGAILYANKKFQQLAGVTIAEPASVYLPEIVPAEEKRLVQRTITQTVDSQQESAIEVAISSPTSAARCLKLSFSVPFPGNTLVGAAEDITEQKKQDLALKESEERLLAIFSTALEAIIVVNPAGRVVYWNRGAERIFGYTRGEALGEDIELLIIPERLRRNDPNALAGMASKALPPLPEGIIEVVARNKKGVEFPVEISSSAIPLNGLWHMVGLMRDITKRKRAEEALQKTHVQLVQAEKLASIGQLAAGVAHEINNPLQYVRDNAQFLHRSLAPLMRLLSAYGKLFDAVSNGGGCQEIVNEVENARQESDAEILEGEIPLAIQQSLEGLEQMAAIVQAMKEFSHPGSSEKVPADINKAVETALMVARNEWKPLADIVTDLDHTLPLVSCFPAQINQVLLNVIVNAAHAVAAVAGNGSEKKGTITMTTRRNGEWAEIRIQDTGPGIPRHILSRIFDPFFTTKRAGKGSGQGLAIAQGVVVKNHGGTIRCESVEGRGATFVIRLPLDERAAYPGESHETADPLC